MSQLSQANNVPWLDDTLGLHSVDSVSQMVGILRIIALLLCLALLSVELLQWSYSARHKNLVQSASQRTRTSQIITLGLSASAEPDGLVENNPMVTPTSDHVPLLDVLVHTVSASAQAPAKSVAAHAGVSAPASAPTTRTQEVAILTEPLPRVLARTAVLRSAGPEPPASPSEELVEQRQLAPEQRLSIGRTMRPYAGTMVNVISEGGDAESAKYAEAFVSTLKLAGLQVAHLTTVKPLEDGEISVVVEPGGQLGAHVRALVYACALARVPVGIQGSSAVPHGMTLLRIGKKRRGGA